MSHVGLGGIVNGLVDGDIDNVSRHARGNDEVSKALALEDLSDEFGAVDDSVNWES
jgi:hypothetical protein